MLKKLKEKVKHLKKETGVLLIAYQDIRTPILAKILIGVTVGYLLSPIDLIPDFIPVLGILDDLILVPLLISVSIKMVPQEVLKDSRTYANNNTQALAKTNYIFATVIIMVWILLIYLTYVNFDSIKEAFLKIVHIF